MAVAISDQSALKFAPSLNTGITIVSGGLNGIQVPSLDLAEGNLFLYPRNYFVQDLIQVGRSLKSQDFPSLHDIGRTLLHVVFKRRIGNVPERFTASMNFSPD